MILIAYRLLAEAARWIAVAGKPFWPADWRVGERLGDGLPKRPAPGRRNVWLHAASLGECKGLWALARELRPLDVDIVLTTNTAAGLDFLLAAIAKDPEPERWRARVAPLDHPRIARRFLDAFDAAALVTFEVELWPHWILAARRAGVPVLWVSARWNARARRRYGVFPAAARRVLRQLDWTQAQAPDDAEALRRAGCPRVEVGGDLRGLQYLEETRTIVPTATGSPPGAESPRAGIAFVSFHARELPALLEMLRAAPDVPLIVFPRKASEVPVFRKALAPLGFALHSENPRAARRIVDRFGLVEATLRATRVAVVGGCFLPDDRIGGHNLWEPLLAGCRVAVGPHHGNQAWLAGRMRAAGLLRVLHGPDEWIAFLSQTDAPDDAETVARVAESARAELSDAASGVRERLAAALARRRAPA